jgi:hypothetical protein
MRSPRILNLPKEPKLRKAKVIGILHCQMGVCPALVKGPPGQEIKGYASRAMYTSFSPRKKRGNWPHIKRTLTKKRAAWSFSRMVNGLLKLVVLRSCIPGMRMLCRGRNWVRASVTADGSEVALILGLDRLLDLSSNARCDGVGYLTVKLVIRA